MAEPQLTHLDASGSASMVDVGDKAVPSREASAAATVRMLPATLDLVVAGGHKKGDVFTVARIAGIQAAKRCSDLIPLCHPLMLSKVDIAFDVDRDASAVHIRSLCRVSGQTGVEMEALTAASVAALTIYDMCKAVDRGITIDNIRLTAKSGGKSGTWTRNADSGPTP